MATPPGPAASEPRAQHPTRPTLTRGPRLDPLSSAHHIGHVAQKKGRKMWCLSRVLKFGPLVCRYYCCPVVQRRQPHQLLRQNVWAMRPPSQFRIAHRPAEASCLHRICPANVLKCLCCVRGPTYPALDDARHCLVKSFADSKLPVPRSSLLGVAAHPSGKHCPEASDRLGRERKQNLTVTSAASISLPAFVWPTAAPFRWRRSVASNRTFDRPVDDTAQKCAPSGSDGYRLMATLRTGTYRRHPGTTGLLASALETHQRAPPAPHRRRPSHRASACIPRGPSQTCSSLMTGVRLKFRSRSNKVSTSLRNPAL